MLLVPVHAIFSSPAIAGIFFAFSLMAGILGRDTRIGFWGFFFISIICTPFVSLIFMFFSSPAKNKA